MQTKIVSAEHRMKEIAILQTHITNYHKAKEVYAGYRKSGYSKKYYAEHTKLLCKKKAGYPEYYKAKLEYRDMLTYQANLAVCLE